MRSRRALGLTVALAAAFAHGAPLRAQDGEPSRARFWIASATIVAASAALDPTMRRAAAAHQRDAASDLAPGLDPIGRARYILPTLAVAIVAPRIAGKRELSNAAIRVAAGYLAADAVESTLKPLVGRHRPRDGGSAWRFHPCARTEEWHSFPSAHTTHAFALATGLAIESGNRWVAAAGYGTAGLVALQRIYTGAHWTSDVTTSAALAIATSGATVRWLRRRGPGPLRRIPAPTLGIGTTGVGAAWSF
ncbi:MAG TPA: phosphatase PAP2 family protein [Gemmatimonadaceae bacterium]